MLISGLAMLDESDELPAIIFFPLPPGIGALLVAEPAAAAVRIRLPREQAC